VPTFGQEVTNVRKIILAVVAAAVITSGTVVPAFAAKRNSSVPKSSGWTSQSYADGALD